MFPRRRLCPFDLCLILVVAMLHYLSAVRATEGAIVTAEVELSAVGGLQPFDGGLAFFNTSSGAVTIGARGGIASDPFSSLDRRGVFEFKIPSVPSGATINSVSLSIGFDGGTASMSGITLQIFGYLADGALSAADFSEKSTLLGSQVWTADTTQNQPWPLTGDDVMLDVTSFLTPLIIGGEQFAGFLIAAASEPPLGQFGYNQAFVNFDAADSASPPVLSIDFTPAVQPPPNGVVPEPAAVLVWGLLAGIVAVFESKSARTRVPKSVQRELPLLGRGADPQ